MADIIYAGKQEGGGLLSQALPIVGLAILGYLAYKVLPGLLGGGDVNGTPSQGANYGPEQGASTLNGGYGPGNQVIRESQVRSNLALSAPTIPNTPIFIEAGPSTSPGFYPGGQGVITTDRPIDNEEAVTILRNLVNSGIPNAWWSTEQTLTPLSGAPSAGINSGGSPQSNIPPGKRHCACTAALRASGRCGPNDDWYYC